MKNEKKRQNRDFHVSRKHTSRWSWNLKIGMDNLYAYTTSQKKFQTQRPSGCRDIASRKTRNLEKRDIHSIYLGIIDVFSCNLVYFSIPKLKGVMR